MTTESADWGVFKYPQLKWSARFPFLFNRLAQSLCFRFSPDFLQSVWIHEFVYFNAFRGCLEAIVENLLNGPSMKISIDFVICSLYSRSRGVKAIIKYPM